MVSPDQRADRIINLILGMLFTIAALGGFAVAFWAPIGILMAVAILLFVDAIMGEVTVLVDMSENNLRQFLVEQAHDQNPPVD